MYLPCICSVRQTGRVDYMDYIRISGLQSYQFFIIFKAGQTFEMNFFKLTPRPKKNVPPFLPKSEPFKTRITRKFSSSKLNCPYILYTKEPHYF